MRKLLVVTSGTIAASVGQELLRQVREHPKSELNVLVRSLDTARLQNRGIRDGEWYQMTIDERHMKAMSQMRAAKPHLARMLFDNLLPFTTGVGASRIRYNGAGAVVVNREEIKSWLSSSMSKLSRSGDSDRTLSVAVIISSVGATGSGSLQRLLEVIADAASDATIDLPINCDTFIMQPDTEGVDELGLANTFALYAELAALRLSRSNTDSERYQGRIILVGWGQKRSLQSIKQLQETTAALVRLINDQTTEFATTYEESRADHHILRQLDDITLLPAHLSTVTAVTISLGSLEEQIIERNAANLITNLVFGSDSSADQQAKDPLLGTLDKYMPGKTHEEKLFALLTHLARGISLRIDLPNTESLAVSKDVDNPKAWLNKLWIDDKTKINQNYTMMEAEGARLVKELTQSWRKSQFKEMTLSSSLSLSSLSNSYRRLKEDTEEMLKIAQQGSTISDKDDDINAALRSVNVVGKNGVETIRKINDKERPGVIKKALDKIKSNVSDYRDQRANAIALEVLQELSSYIGTAYRDLHVVLTRLNRERQTIEAVAGQKLILRSDHMLEIAALSPQSQGEKESEIDSYYKKVSPLAPRPKRRISSIGDASAETGDPYLEFRRWLGEDVEREEHLFKGDIELLRNMAREYTQGKVAEEIQKNSVLDILLQDTGEMLRRRLRDASARAYSLINFNAKFAPAERKEKLYVCAYWGDDDRKRGELQKAVDDEFGQGRCMLMSTKDPTEIVVFYYIDGLSMAAIEDLTGRCLEAFLNQRQKWYTQQKDNPTQNVGIPVYSGKDAEERVLKQNIICKLRPAAQVSFEAFRDLPEVKNCFTSEA